MKIELRSVDQSDPPELTTLDFIPGVPSIVVRYVPRWVSGLLALVARLGLGDWTGQWFYFGRTMWQPRGVVVDRDNLAPIFYGIARIAQAHRWLPGLRWLEYGWRFASKAYARRQDAEAWARAGGEPKGQDDSQ